MPTTESPASAASSNPPTNGASGTGWGARLGERTAAVLGQWTPWLGVPVAAVWGANFVAAKYGMMHFPPFYLMALRFVIVAAVLVPFVRVPRHAMKHIVFVSMLLGTVHFAFMFAAMWHGLDVSTTAITGQLAVPFACLLGSVLYQDRLGPWRTAGMVLSFLGIAIVAGTPRVLEYPLGFGMAVIGAFAWGAANVYMKRMPHVDSLAMLGWMALFSVPQLLLISFIFEAEHDHWALLWTVPPLALGGLLYSVFCSTILAYGIWYYLLRRYPVSQITPFSLLVPVFGVCCGVLTFGDPLTSNILLGGALALVGVGIIVVRRPKLGTVVRD